MKKIFANSKSSNNAPVSVSDGTNYYAHYIGKTFQLSKHQVTVEEIIAEGGFSIVFLVKSNVNSQRYALKRMYVNNEIDLAMCKMEIRIIKSLSEHNDKVLKYVDSAILRQSTDIYEILLLTKYCRLGGVIQLMNERLNSSAMAASTAAHLSQPSGRLSENEIIHIFCDICEAVAELHYNNIIHRDLKIEKYFIFELI
jgi:AP2-associated kinase